MDWLGKLIGWKKQEDSADTEPVSAETPEITAEDSRDIPASPPPDHVEVIEEEIPGKEGPGAGPVPPEVEAPSPDTAAEAQEPAPARDDRGEGSSDRTREVLNRFLMTEDVTAAMVVTLDGFVISSAGHTDADLEAVGVLVSSEMSAALTLSEETGSGNLNQIILEFNNGRVVAESIGEDMIIAITGSAQSNLGMLRLVINNLKGALIESLRF